MASAGTKRVRHVKQSIVAIRVILAGRTLEQAHQDRVLWLAFERSLEMLSEASRHIPAEWKLDFPGIPWRQVGDLGNALRHAYHDLDALALWTIYEHDLAPLEAAIDAMLAAHDLS